MPASITRDDNGSRPKVIGSSIAMVGIGPMPGSTPIKVPSRQPRKAKPRFLSVAAALKPVARFWMRSNSILPAPPGGKRLRQPVDEQDDAKYGEAGSEQDRLGQVHVATRVAGEDGEQRCGDRQADLLDHVAERQDRRDDDQDRPQLDGLDARAFDGQALEPDDNADAKDGPAQNDREIARPHARGRAEREIAPEIGAGQANGHEDDSRPDIL